MLKRLLVIVVFALPLFAAPPADQLPAGVEHWSAASIKGMEKALAEKAAKDPNRLASEKLADFPNDLFMMAHREKDGQPEWHENQTDIFVVESGSATLIVGGELKGAETVSEHEKRNGTIEGGSRVKLVQGDVVRIPARTPHQLLLNGSGKFNYFVIKVKGY